MSDELYGFIEDENAERHNQRRREPDFLDDDRGQSDINPSHTKIGQQSPSFLESQDNKTEKKETPIFESRRRNISPSIKANKQKDSSLQQKKVNPQKRNNPSDEEDASNDEANIRSIFPLKKEDAQVLPSKDFDNSYNQSKKITTPKSINQNENYKPQIMTKNLDKDKTKGEIELRDMEQRMRKKEEQYIKEVEELKQSHKEELSSYQKMLKAKEKELNDEISYLRMEKNDEVKKTKETMSLLHQSEIDSLEKKTDRLLKEQKMKFDSENETLKRQLEQQIEYNKLVAKVETSSKYIDELMQRIQSEKQTQVSDSKAYKESLEKLETRLNSMEDNLNKDKELLLKEKEAFEHDQVERKKINAEESLRIKGEISRLEQLQSKIRIEEYSIKEKYEKEKIDLNRRHDEMKLELETTKATYQTKLNEVDYQRKMFEEEKKYFDKYKDDSLKNIDNKKYELENLKEKFYSEEKEIKSRIAIMQEKEFYLTEKFEEFEKERLTQNEKEEKIEKDRKELIIAAKRIEDSIKALDEKGRLLEKEKNELMKQYNEIESERMNMNSEKIIIDQEKSEMRLRLQSIDMLRMKYITENRPMFNATAMPIQSASGLTGNNLFSKPMINSSLRFNQRPIENNANYYSSVRPNNSGSMNMTSFNKEIGGGFNADKYFDSIKNKIQSHSLIENNNYDSHEESNQFNRIIMKEKDYIKKSNELFENNSKNEYEKMRKNNFDSIHLPNLKSEDTNDDPLRNNAFSPTMNQMKDSQNNSIERKKNDSPLDNSEEIQDE